MAENPEAKLEQATKTFSNIKTLATAIITAIGVIFAAGVYYSELSIKLKEYIDKIDRLEKQVSALSADLAAEKTNIRASVNRAFSRVVDINNVREPFTNTEAATSGGGHAATIPPRSLSTR